MSEFVPSDLAAGGRRTEAGGALGSNGTAATALDGAAGDAAPPASKRAKSSKAASKDKDSHARGALHDGNGGASVPNHDFCEACDLGGSLLCCDRCPNSFHLTCLDPPLAAVPDGDWFCSFCTRSRPVQAAPAHSAKEAVQALLEQLAASHPRVYWPPRPFRTTTSKDAPAPGDEDSSDSSDSPSSAAPEESVAARFRDFDRSRSGGSGNSKKKQRPNECAECHQTGLPTDLVTCYKCKKTFHVYCVEPPLSGVPLRDWFCPAHDGYRSQRSYVLPAKTLRLDFAPLAPAREDRRKPARTFRTSRGPQRAAKDSPLFVAAPATATPPAAVDNEDDEQPESGQRTTGEYVVALAALQHEMERADVRQFGPGESFLARRRQERRQRATERTQEELLDLHFLQAQLLPLALPSTVAGAAATGGGPRGRLALEVPPSVVSHLSPLMVQFLAWQRLVELHEQIRAMPPLSPEALQQASLVVPAIPAPRPAALPDSTRRTAAPPTQPPLPAASALTTTASATRPAEHRRPPPVPPVLAPKVAPLGPPPPRAAASTSRSSAAPAPPERKRKPPEPRAPPAKRTTVEPPKPPTISTPTSPTASDAATVPNSPATPHAAPLPPLLPAPVVPTGGDPPPRIAFLAKNTIAYQFENKREIRVGRKKVPEPGQPNPDINLTEIEPGQGAVVSRNHALIYWSPNDRSYRLRNYGRNGTTVNGKKHYGEEDVLLAHGSKLRIGKNSFVVQIGHQPVPAAAEDGKDKDSD